MLRGFRVISESVAALEDYCREKNMSASDLVGLAADTRRTLPTCRSFSNTGGSSSRPRADRDHVWIRYLTAGGGPNTSSSRQI
jgi:hypothetical protein